MELHTVRSFSNLPQINPKLSSPIKFQSQSLLLCKNHVSLLHKQTRFNSGLHYRSNLCLRSKTSDELSSDAAGSIQYVEDEKTNTLPHENEEKIDSRQNEAPQEDSSTDNLQQQLSKFLDDFNVKVNIDPQQNEASQEDSSTDNLQQQLSKFFDDLSVKKSEVPEEDSSTDNLQQELFVFLDDLSVKLNEATQEGSSTDNLQQQLFKLVDDLNVKKEKFDSQQNEAPHKGSLTNDPRLLFKFLEDFNVKFDYEDKYSLLVLGGGCAGALWLVAAVVGAIDSIPVIPKVLELIGLGYAVWFSSRYLIFKRNRDELAAQVEQIKKQVLGHEDD